MTSRRWRLPSPQAFRTRSERALRKSSNVNELEADPPPLAQLSALIRHWLHREPPEDPVEFFDLAQQALWLEKRYLRRD